VGPPELSRLLDGLDQEIADAGGRVYLAKDSRLRPDLLATMYPRLEGFEAVRARVDPGGVLVSDLARRLGLVPAVDPAPRKPKTRSRTRTKAQPRATATQGGSS